MYRIRRFNVVKTATVVAVMYMVIIAVFVVPFLILFAFVGIAGTVSRCRAVSAPSSGSGSSRSSSTGSSAGSSPRSRA